MSRPSVLNTLRPNAIFFNLSNFNTKFFLLGLNFLKAFKQLLLNKNILLCNETLNFSNNKMFFDGALFFRFSKLKEYKKKRKLPTPVLTLKQKGSKDAFFTLAKTVASSLKINIVFSNFSILNRTKNVKFLRSLQKQLSVYSSQLFPRRYGLFLDFLKLTSLFFSHHIDLKTYLYIITEVFKYLQKRQHANFYLFLNVLMKLFLDESKKFKKGLLAKFVGIKIAINGRLKGKAMASGVKLEQGVLPLQTLSANIEFAKSYTFTKRYGVFGFKMWVYRT